MGTYAGLDTHRYMNFDPVRNAAYQRAIRDAVGTDSVVLDLGAGLGLLGFFAARAGAPKVYLVEREPVIHITRQVAEANGLTNVECIQATIERLELPESAEVIISVFTGNFLLNEDLLPTLFLARDRFLAPGGCLLPDRGRMWAAPVSMPQFYVEHVEAWTRKGSASQSEDSSGFDYSLVHRYAANCQYHVEARQHEHRLLGKSAVLSELDFNTAERAECDAYAEYVISEGGNCHGWLGWFDMRLGDHWLSTAPDAEATHWLQVFMPLERPIAARPGDRLSLSLKRPEFGEWAWTTTFEGQVQRQSTFLASPHSPQALARQSESFQPQMSANGAAMQFVLSCCDGRTTISNLADALLERFGDQFVTRGQALRFVRSIVAKLG